MLKTIVKWLAQFPLRCELFYRRLCKDDPNDQFLPMESMKSSNPSNSYAVSKSSIALTEYWAQEWIDASPPIDWNSLTFPAGTFRDQPVAFRSTPSEDAAIRSRPFSDE